MRVYGPVVADEELFSGVCVADDCVFCDIVESAQRKQYLSIDDSSNISRMSSLRDIDMKRKFESVE